MKKLAYKKLQMYRRLEQEKGGSRQYRRLQSYWNALAVSSAGGVESSNHLVRACPDRRSYPTKTIVQIQVHPWTT
jgi:hypothetical protein